MEESKKFLTEMNKNKYLMNMRLLTWEKIWTMCTNVMVVDKAIGGVLRPRARLQE
jgi:hypothetical protein